MLLELVTGERSTNVVGFGGIDFNFKIFPQMIGFDFVRMACFHFY